MCEVMGVLITPIVNLPYRACISNQHTVHLWHIIIPLVNYTSIELNKGSITGRAVDWKQFPLPARMNG